MNNGDERLLRLDLIEDNPALQMRSEIDEDGIAQMSEAYREHKKLPPVKAVYDEELKKYHLYDGHRRCRAARLAEIKSLPCIVTHGRLRDAVLLAVAANQEHDTAGRGRSSRDKRNAVARLLDDYEWCKWSDSRIAGYVGVSVSFVSSVRRELEMVAGSAASEAKDEPREGLDGRRRVVRRQVAEDVAVSEEPESDILPPEPEPEPEAEPEFDYGSLVEESTAEETVESFVPEPESEPEPEFSTEPDSEYEATVEVAAEPQEEPPAFKQCEQIERIWKEHNATIEHYARSVSAILKSAPDSPWMQERKTTIKQLLDSAANAIRGCKCHEAPCPKCNGYGNVSLKECKACRGFGCMPETTYHAMGGQ